MERFKILFVFILFSVATTALADLPVLQLNVTGKAPLNTISKKGFMDEVATEAFRRIGYGLATLSLPAERGLRNADRGLVDGEMSRVKGLDKIYMNLVRVPEKIMDWEFVAFSNNPISMENGWAALSGKTVAHINGWKILEKNIPEQAEVTKTSSADNLFKLIQRNRADYVLYERWGGRYLLKKMKMSNVKMCNPPLAVKEMFIYLHKKHQALVPKLASALANMKKDGSYQKLVDKHLRQFE